MIINRTWHMANKNTFSIKPVAELINRYNDGSIISIDPFANQSKIAKITNDLDEQYTTNYHLDAIDFLKIFDKNSIDLVFFDPPYSMRQVSESYKKLGRTVNMETTQMSYWSNLKDQIARIVKAEGIVISCAWNTSGVGKTRGFKIIEILLVAHGGARNDTIVTVDKKIQHGLEG